MPKDRLTEKQRRLVRELDELCELFSLDYHNIKQYDRESRTTYLELAKNRLIRSQIIIWYTLTDEFLNMCLCHYFFGKDRSFPQLWRTKKFQIFNYHVLENLSLLQKLRFARAIKPLPKKIVGTVERLNALRNGIAHAFFPENLRTSRPVWKGKNVFSPEGVKLLQADMQEVFDHFLAQL